MLRCRAFLVEDNWPLTVHLLGRLISSMAAKTTGVTPLVLMLGDKDFGRLFDQSLKLKAKWKIKTKADRGGDVVIDRIVRAARELVEDQGLRMADIRAIGLGVPGVVIKGRVFNATIFIGMRWPSSPSCAGDCACRFCR